jgi:DNA processing protein
LTLGVLASNLSGTFLNHMPNDLIYSLILASIEGLGCRGAHRLLDSFQTPSAVFSASVGDLIQQGVSEPVAQSLLSRSKRIQAEAELAKCQQNNLQVLTFHDDAYPKILKQIYDPPILLFVKGDLTCLNTPSIAIVGSRRATPYGINAAEKLARELAQRGLTICSGLARGIDSAAHRGALEVQGKTVAVLGSGLDHIYPRENRRMAEQIEKSGCVVSEFPMGTSPTPQNFPIRNRIISGLSLGVCLVEAAEFSGSLITARLALEQGREVLAIPGNITSKNSFGPNLWIKQGAKLVQDWQDIVEELPRPIKEEVLFSSKTSSHGPGPSLFPDVLTAAEKCVLELLRDDEASHVDHLLEQSRLTSSELLSTLSELEMKDKIKQLPGKNFVRKV